MRTDLPPDDFTNDRIPGTEVGIGFQLWAMMIPTIVGLALIIVTGEWW